MYIKFLKNKSIQNEQICKNYKHLFEKLRKKAKQTYYQSILKDYQNDMKRTWQVMKEITGKSKINSNRFPKTVNFNGNSTKKDSRIAEEFNKYFTNVQQNLTSKIQNTSKTFEDFLLPVQKNVEYRDFNFEEFEKDFKSVKRNKAAGHDNIDSNVIIKVYDEISYPLFMIFHISFNEGIFPEQLKVAKVFPIFKVGNIEEGGNYRPISVLPIFSKVLERTMHNRTYQYFKENDMFFSKQFDFQVNKTKKKLSCFRKSAG